MGDPTQKLVDEFCSLLDEAIILSICSDYDINKPEGFADVRTVLLALSADVPTEEASGFNPSGYSGDNLASFSPSNEGMVEGDLRSNDGLTTTTESSNPSSLSRNIPPGSSKSSVEGTPDVVHVGCFDNLTDDEKEQALAAMFVSLKPADIKLALQKVKGDADLAIDELLNRRFLENIGARPKGVDGFFVSDDDTPQSKKKGKKKAKKFAATSPTTTVKGPDRDEMAENDNITFMSDHFSLPIAEATDLYRRNKSSLGTAILSILDNYRALGLASSNGSEQLRWIEEQKKRVPWIPHEYFNSIINTTTTYQTAIGVVDALASHFKRPTHLKLHVPYRIVPSELEMASDVPLPSSPASPRREAYSPITRSPTHQPFRTIPATLEEAGAAKASIAASRNLSHATASSAFRRGRSDPLMRQVGSYYMEEMRNKAASHRQAISAEAELLVDKNSKPGQLDLHGVSVLDGVNIALNRTWRWWNALSEQARSTSRVRRETFEVITGWGRHTVDGRSQLRASVIKALVADGWKIEILTGSCRVVGRT